MIRRQVDFPTQTQVSERVSCSKVTLPKNTGLDTFLSQFFPHHLWRVPLYFYASLRRITYASNVSSSFGRFPWSMFNEPQEGVIRSHCGSGNVCLTSPEIVKSKVFQDYRVRKNTQKRTLSVPFLYNSLARPKKG